MIMLYILLVYTCVGVYLEYQNAKEE